VILYVIIWSCRNHSVAKLALFPELSLDQRGDPHRPYYKIKKKIAKMGVSIDVWRIRIGCFSPKYRQSKCIFKNKLIVTPRKGFFLHCFVVICFMLIIGGIETNPGPTLQEIQELITASENSLMSKIAELVNNSKKETIKAVNDVKTDVSNLSSKFLT
jgi:hypothetical protein